RSTCRCYTGRRRPVPGSGRSHDAAHADVGGRGVDRLPLARSGSVAQAVVRRTEVRAALDHTPREGLDRQTRRRTACGRSLVRGRRGEPVRRPLPDVAAHVVEAEAVRRKARDRRGALVAVELEVLPGELALPGVCSWHAAREVLVPPGEGGAVQPAARGALPFGLGRELLPAPGRLRLRVLEGDVQ